MSAPNTYIVASGKGGTGKTSFVAALGTLAAKCGDKVAVIDMDMGQRNLDIALGLENRVVFDIGDVSSGVCRLKQASLSPEENKWLTMISASQVVKPQDIDSGKCASVVKTLSEMNDLVLLDAPAGIGDGLKLCCACADKAIMIVTADMAAVRDCSRAINVMKECGVKDFQVVVNRVKPYQEAFDYELTPEEIYRWLDCELLGVIHESAAQTPLMGNREIALTAQALMDDESLEWPAVKPTLAQRLASVISKFGKRTNNAKSI